MTEVKIKIPPELPEKIAIFELEREIARKNQRMKSIKTSIEMLELSEKDIELFDKARSKAWHERKKELL